MGLIKALMRSNVEERTSLDEVSQLDPLRRLSGLAIENREDEQIEGNGARNALRPALAEEEEWFLPFILAECEWRADE